MVYRSTLRGERFTFARLPELPAKANEVKSGDQLAGLAARSERERVAAKLALADVRVAEIVATAVVEDAVTEAVSVPADPARLALRGDHAAARDAVSTPLDLDAPGMAALADRFPWAVVATMAGSRDRYLRRPDLGRRLTPQARQTIRAEHGPGPDVQFVIGDGLSSTAVHAQVPALLPLVHEGCAVRGWSVGRPIVVRQCRVGVLNEIGELLDPAVVVLLIGERPGLATAESLSAYLAYRPRPGHTDADRNLLSNIHREGIPVREAASRIVGLVEALMADGQSGVAVKEAARLDS